MSEGKQINIWAPAELVARLEEIQPAGVALAVVARKLIEKGLGAAAGDLPPLSGGVGRTIATVDWAPVMERFTSLDGLVREILRSVHEQGGWVRGRIGGEDEASKAAAKDYGEDRVREWEKSVGRGDWA